MYQAGETDNRKHVRIFISSPGDVGDERDRARQVIESLRRRYSRSLTLKHILWEDLPLQPAMSFQEGIDVVLNRDIGVDIAVFILWSRFGSPQDILKPDGSKFLSGTEREFHLMLEAQARSQAMPNPAAANLRPDILVYRRSDDSSFDERLRSKSSLEQAEMESQNELVDQFFKREFYSSEGQSLRAYHPYERPVGFSQRLRTHLIELLDGISGGTSQGIVWDIDLQGPPFVGLEAFHERHADVFFGREEEVLEARRALSEQARNGCAFLLVSGASGSGKSSLVRAGVLPSIVENELDDRVTSWCTLVTTLSELLPHPIPALVSRMAADAILPEVAKQPDSFAGTLAPNSRESVKAAIGHIFEFAAARKGGPMRLLLVIDQMEEFFSTTQYPTPIGQDFSLCWKRSPTAGMSG